MIVIKLMNIIVKTTPILCYLIPFVDRKDDVSELGFFKPPYAS